jgi:hypothetical protein
MKAGHATLKELAHLHKLGVSGIRGWVESFPMAVRGKMAEKRTWDGGGATSQSPCKQVPWALDSPPTFYSLRSIIF